MRVEWAVYMHVGAWGECMPIIRDASMISTVELQESDLESLQTAESQASVLPDFQIDLWQENWAHFS